MKRPIRLALLLLVLLVACGDDSDSPTGPGDRTATASHYEISIQTSSIWAQNDCENTPGNPGDFRWRLIIRTPDALGNDVVVHDTGVQSETIPDGLRQGVVMEPVRFLVPNQADASFEVEYWIGEYDPGTDFERHSWSKHTRDRREDQMWASGVRSYESDRYTENEDGSGSGLYKFAVWDTRAECSGAAYYYVTWKPVTPEPEPNQAPTVDDPLSGTFHELDGEATMDLLSGASDPEGDPLSVTNFTLVSGDDTGLTLQGNALDVDPGAYASLGAGEFAYIVHEYAIADGQGNSVQQSVNVRINGG
jgi:hypothetical protein